jgi:EmrB/QacA subfamily drug resistance transporter
MAKSPHSRVARWVNPEGFRGFVGGYGSAVATGLSRARLARLLVEPPRPAAIRDSPRAPWLVVAAVCIGAFMGQLDASIVNLAYSDLQRSFHASLGAVEWVALSYLLVLVGLVVAIGRFADTVGRKLLYTYGFVLFTVASAACAVAPNLPVLVGLRAVQAVGAAMLQANSVALITLAMPRDKLGRGIGLQGAAQALGLALGPSIGGLLVAAGGWRSVFLVNVPAGIVGTVLAWVLLPRSRDLAERTPVDLVGLALLVLTTTSLLAGLSMSADGRVSPVAPIVAVAVAVGAGAVLRRHTIRLAAAGGTPLLPPDLLALRPLRVGLGAGLVSYLVLFGVLFVTPLLLQRELGLHAAEAGLVLTVVPVSIAVLAPVAGRALDRSGPRLPTTVGLVAMTAGLVIAGLCRGSLAGVVVGLTVIGAGIGAFTPANNASVMGAAPRRRAGLAGGVLNMVRGIGTATGVAVTGLLFSVASGSGHSAAGAADGFLLVMIVLAALAGGSALVTARNGG